MIIMKKRFLLVLIVSVLISAAAAAPYGAAAVFAGTEDAGIMSEAELTDNGGTSGSAALTAFPGYVHDPMENPEAAKDIVPDPEAVYGYKPAPDSTRLSPFLVYDWTDPEVVADLRRQREEYHAGIQELSQMIADMKAEGKSTEEIARAVSTRRNEIRIESYKDDPEGLEALKKSNLEKYGNEMGPTPEYLYNRYGSWGMVISKALSSNEGADACLGLYDEYYDTYITDTGKEWSEDWKYYVLNGVTYDKNDVKAEGLTVIDGKTYLFKEGVKKTGFVDMEDGSRYFDGSGVMATGLTMIDGSRYYFDKSGKMKTGAVKSGGKLYYFLKSGKGRAAKGWFKGIDKKKRYSLGNGRIAAGVRKVGKKYYFFRKGSGTLQKKGFFKSGKKEYYSKGGGKLATGWTTFGKKACYFYPKGKKAGQMAKNTKIGRHKIPKSGRVSAWR